MGASRLAEAADNPHINIMAPDQLCGAAATAEAHGYLAVTRLVLTDFRCYRHARIAVDRRAIVLTGPNGAGKTNMLEAISFLAPGRGLRRARLGEVDRREVPATAGAGTDGDPAPAATPWAVAATLATPRGPVQIGTGREATPSGGERRIVRIEGAQARSQTALAEHVNLVWLTPTMDRLFHEGAGARRRFLDRLVYGFDPEHAARVSAYDRAMRERGKLLREGGGDRTWLAALEESMAQHGVAIVAARRDVAARLDEACADGVAGFPRAILAAMGTVETWLAEHPALTAEDMLRQRLSAGRREDAESGGASVGPHRSDLAVRHGGTGIAAAQCSTGEQKALLIAILLAHARLQTVLRGAAPIMLLDEVAAHLDGDRRRALFAELAALGSQAWMTGTEEVLFEDLRGTAQFLRIVDAVVSET
jgi:DNA replication and repair protein RecF